MVGYVNFLLASTVHTKIQELNSLRFLIAAHCLAASVKLNCVNSQDPRCGFSRLSGVEVDIVSESSLYPLHSTEASLTVNGLRYIHETEDGDGQSMPNGIMARLRCGATGRQEVCYEA